MLMIFSAWFEFVREELETRALLVKIISRMINAYTGRGFHHWIKQIRAEEKEEQQREKENRQEEKMSEDWARETEEKMLKREKAIAAIAKLQGDITSQVFVSWRVCVKREKRNRTIAASFAAKIRRRSEVAAVQSWLEFLAWRNDARRLIGRVIGGPANRLLHSAWRVWAHESAEAARCARDSELRARESELAAQRAELAELRAARAAFTREKSENFVKRWMHDAIFGSFALWVTYRAERKATRERIGKLLMHAEQRFSRVAFSCWKETVTTDKHRQVTLERFAFKMKNRFALAVYRAWTFAASEWKRERVVLARCALKIQRRLERSMLDSWIEYAEEQKEAKALLIRILNRMIHTYTGKGFHHWRNQLRSADEAKLHGTVEAQEHERLLAEKLLKREKAIGAIVKLQGDAIMRVFVSWRTCVQREKRNRAVCAAFAVRLRGRHVAASLASWLEFLEWRNHGRYLLGRILGGIERAYLIGAWMVMARAAARKAADSELEKLRAQLDANQAETAALREKQADKSRQKCARFAQNLMHASFVSCFTDWQSWCAERIATRKRIGKLLMHAEQRFSRVAFECWRDTAAAAVQRQVTLERFAFKMKNRFTLAVYRAWTFAASEWKRERVVLARCALKIQRRLERSMLDSWIEYAEEQKEAKALLIRILNRMIHTYTGKGFHHWRNQLRRALLAEVRVSW